MPLPAAPVERGPWTPDAILGNTPQDNVRRELIDGWLYIDGQPVDHPMPKWPPSPQRPATSGS